MVMLSASVPVHSGPSNAPHIPKTFTSLADWSLAAPQIGFPSTLTSKVTVASQTSSTARPVMTRVLPLSPQSLEPSGHGQGPKPSVSSIRNPVAVAPKKPSLPISSVRVASQSPPSVEVPSVAPSG